MKKSELRQMIREEIHRLVEFDPVQAGLNIADITKTWRNQLSYYRRRLKQTKDSKKRAEYQKNIKWLENKLKTGTSKLAYAGTQVRKAEK